MSSKVVINMELIKKINNNFAVGRDSSGQFVIVSGRGIGFEKMPCIVSDISKITRTYYDVDDRFIDLIQQIPEDLIKLTTKIVDYASSKLQQKLNPNLFFTLADHINFAIKRARKGIEFHFGITYEMRYLHADEMKIGEEVVALINKTYGVEIASDEAAVIAMHILEAKSITKKVTSKNSALDHIILGLCEIMNRTLKITIEKDSFNFCRFVTHIQYLLQRRDEKKEITSANSKLCNAMKKEFPETYRCVMDIKIYFKEELKWDVSEEELLYLMLHINRLCNKEDCNQ